MFMKCLRKRPRLTVLYGTESGRAKRFARHLETTFKVTFWAQFSCLDNYNFNLDTKQSQFLAIVTSTFGNGEAPSNAEVRRFSCFYFLSFSSLSLHFHHLFICYHIKIIEIFFNTHKICNTPILN